MNELDVHERKATSNERMFKLQNMIQMLYTRVKTHEDKIKAFYRSTENKLTRMRDELEHKFTSHIEEKMKS